MATVAEVKKALDEIASAIALAASNREQAKNQLLAARNNLAGLPSKYSGVISTIDGYPASGGTAFEALAKAEKAALASEFISLKNSIETELNDLGVAW